MKAIKLKNLKKLLDSMTETELEQPLYVNRDDMGVSGSVIKIRKSSSDLIWDGEDDPSTLKTRKALADEGHDKAEIARMSVEIPKGGIYLEF